MKCSNCGNEIESGRLSCPICGSIVSQSSYSQASVNGQQSGNGGAIFSSVKDMLSVIFGFLSIVSSLLLGVAIASIDDTVDPVEGRFVCAIITLAAIIFSILAIVLKRKKIAGMVLGIITISIVVIILAVSVGQSIGYEAGYNVPWYEKIFE